MTRKKVAVLGSVLILLIVYFYNNFLFKKTVVGTYVNTNYNYPPFLAEIPYTPDTLILKANDTFSSTYFGNGNYKLSYTVRGTKIELRQKKSGFETQMKRRFFNNPEIILFADQDHYYRKIR